MGGDTYRYTPWEIHAATGWDGTPAPVHVVQWCGHAKEHVAWPVEDGRFVLVEILGEAR